MSNLIVSAGIVLALLSISLTGACIFHFGGDLIKRWRKARAERRQRVWVWRILR